MKHIRLLLILCLPMVGDLFGADYIAPLTKQNLNKYRYIEDQKRAPFAAILTGKAPRDQLKAYLSNLSEAYITDAPTQFAEILYEHYYEADDQNSWRSLTHMGQFPVVVPGSTLEFSFRPLRAVEALARVAIDAYAPETDGQVRDDASVLLGKAKRLEGYSSALYTPCDLFYIYSLEARSAKARGNLIDEIRCLTTAVRAAEKCCEPIIKSRADAWTTRLTELDKRQQAERSAVGAAWPTGIPLQSRKDLHHHQARQPTLDKLDFCRKPKLDEQELKKAKKMYESAIAQAWQDNDPLKWVVEHANWYAQRNGDTQDSQAGDSAANLNNPMRYHGQSKGLFRKKKRQFDQGLCAEALFDVAQHIGQVNFYDPQTDPDEADFAIGTATRLSESGLRQMQQLPKQQEFQLDAVGSLHVYYWMAHDAKQQGRHDKEMHSLGNILVGAEQIGYTFPNDILESCKVRYTELSGLKKQRLARERIHRADAINALQQNVHGSSRDRSLSF